MSECNKCNGTLFVCENHPDQEAHQCKHCKGAGMPCECTKISELIGKSEQLPVAWFYEDDDIKWVTLNKDVMPDNAIPLYTHPVKDLEDIEINITWNENSMRDFGKDELNFARAILKKASEK